MGECNYFFKAQFQTPAAAKKALPKIQKFLLETLEAHDFGQANRGDNMTTEAFWMAFNGLAGYLDLCSYKENVKDIQLDGSVIGYAAIDVGHFANWSPLADFLKTQFGAIKVAISNELPFLLQGGICHGWHQF